MKKIKLLFFISFLSSICNAQVVDYNTQVLYTMTFQKDSLDSTNRTSMAMELLISDSSSLFQNYRDRQKDSVLLFHDNANKNADVKPGRLIIRPVHKFSYRIVKQNQKIYFYDSLYGLGLEGKNITYAYEEDATDFDWILSADTAIINGFLCQKAALNYGGRKWFAWFTAEIPISDGPYKFSGLPGLIIKVHDQKNHWIFNMSSIKKVDIAHQINFQKWFDIKHVTKDKLFKDRREFENNLPTMVSSSVSLEVVEELKKSIKSDNNWIELYR